MIKFCLLILLSLFTLSGCYSVKQEGLIENSSLRMALNEDHYLKDFGSIRAGEVVKHSFVIKNASQKVLNIKDVSTSCGCAVSEVKNKILKPGESTFMEVKFNSQGYSGAVEQFVYVNTDSLDNSLIRFIIKADVRK